MVRFLITGAMSAYAMLGTVATAQEANDEVIDEIIVTALKRTNQTQAAAPAAIDVIDGSAIDALGADSLLDVLPSVPALSTDSDGVGFTTIQIRGVNTTFGAASVGYYVDGAPFSLVNLNQLPDLDPFDLQSIEILKGPQGTLYGAGSAGGVVLVRTRQPNMSKSEVRLRALVSDTSDGGQNTNASAAVNVPLIHERLGFRASASYFDNSGWIDGSVTGRSETNDEERRSFRIKLLAAPTNNFTILLSAINHNLSAGADILADNSNSYADYKDHSRSNDYDIYLLGLNYSNARFYVESSTSYTDYAQSLRFTAGPVVDFPTQEDLSSLVHETRFGTTGDDSFNWVTGIFYRDADRFSSQDATSIGFGESVDDFTSEQWSLYGEVSRMFANGDMELSLGVARFRDELQHGGSNVGVPVPIREMSVDRWTPKAAISYFPSDRLSLYANYSEGFRSAVFDFNVSTFLAQLVDPSITGRVGPEDHTALEAGLKAVFMDGKLAFRTAAFSTKIEDVQQSAAVQDPNSGLSANTILNAGDALSRGIEVTLEGVPTDSLRFSLAGSYTKAEIDGDFFAPGAGPSEPPLFADGTPLNLVPEWVIGASLDYERQLGRQDLTGGFFVSLQYASERALTILQAPPRAGESITRVDARLSIGTENWRVFLFGENLGDERDVVAPSVVQNFFEFVGEPFDGILGSRLRPRTLGIGVSAAF